MSPARPMMSPLGTASTVDEGRQMLDTSEAYQRDLVRRVDIMRRIQQQLYDEIRDKKLTLGVCQVALLLLMDYDILESSDTEDLVELLSNAAPFVKHCLGKNIAPGDSKSAMYAILKHHDPELWKDIHRFGISDKLDGTTLDICALDERFNITAMADDAMIAVKPINIPRRQDPDNPLVEYICVEWRCLPRLLGDTFGCGGEGMKYIKGQSLGKTPTPQRKIDVEADGLAEFLERQLRKTAQTDPNNGLIRVCLPSGRHVVLCTRFEIPVARNESNETFALLKLSWMALCLASMSGAAEVIDRLNDKPDEDWEEVRVRLRDQKRMSLEEWEEAQGRAEDEACRAQSDSSA